MQTFLTIALTLIAAVGYGAPADPAEPRAFQGKCYTIPRKFGVVAMFDALLVTEDGKVYMGTSTYTHGAQLLELDRKTGAIRAVVDLEQSLKQHGDNAILHSKIHTHLTRSKDGVIYCMAMHPEGSAIYGLSFPGGKLFSVDLESASVRDYGPVAKNARPSHYALNGRYAGRARTWTYIPLGRAIVFDEGGTLHGSAEAKLFRLGEEALKPVFHEGPLPIPGAGGFYSGLHKGGHGELVVDAFVAAGDGKLYGGTRRGYLFCLDPATGKVVNLGKPLRQGRIRALCWSKGSLYGIGGEERGRSHLFRYRVGDGFSIRPIPPALSGYWMQFYCNHYDVLLRDSDGGLWLGGAGRMTDVLKIEPW